MGEIRCKWPSERCRHALRPHTYKSLRLDHQNTFMGGPGWQEKGPPPHPNTPITAATRATRYFLEMNIYVFSFLETDESHKSRLKLECFRVGGRYRISHEVRPEPEHVCDDHERPLGMQAHRRLMFWTCNSCK